METMRSSDGLNRECLGPLAWWVHPVTKEPFFLRTAQCRGRDKVAAVGEQTNRAVLHIAGTPYRCPKKGWRFDGHCGRAQPRETARAAALHFADAGHSRG